MFICIYTYIYLSINIYISIYICRYKYMCWVLSVGVDRHDALRLVGRLEEPLHNRQLH